MRTSIPHALAAAALAVAAASAYAVPLGPGASAALPGTTVAAQPQLAGLVLEDVMSGFTMNTAGGIATGRIQSRVVRSDLDGTLDFYWRVLNDATSQADVAFFRVGDFVAPEYDANYRIDGVGDVAPVAANRFAGAFDSYVNFDFTRQDEAGANHGIAPGQSSNFMLLDTSATEYARNAVMDVAWFGTVALSNISATFGPAASRVSEPATAWLASLALLAAARRRRKVR